MEKETMEKETGAVAATGTTCDVKFFTRVRPQISYYVTLCQVFFFGWFFPDFDACLSFGILD
jgi:hypothetical protein